MSVSQDETLSNIRQYVAKARKLQEEHMDVDIYGTEARLDSTIKELQAQVEQKRAELEKLREASETDIGAAAYASSDPRERLKQLRAVKTTYTRLTPETPFLPAKGSVLPALLAARILRHNIQGTKDAIASSEEQLGKIGAKLHCEEANLHDANLLTKAMEARIEKLQTLHEERAQKTPAQLAKEIIAAKRQQRRFYDEKVSQLGEQFHVFVTEVLSPMLAAEELGGPVVGDMPDVENETLAAGFTQKGRAKSTKNPPPEKQRQRRIDQIWGSKAIEGEDRLTEAEAADNEMRKLIEDLFATLSGPGGGKAYYELERDSAASRFLVRAKIAQFHPRDARKVRLIDFGRELDD